MLPQIKKRLSSFILDESGKISKRSLIKLSILSAVASTYFVMSSKIVSASCGGGGCGSCGCGCGGGGGGGAGGGCGGGGADPCAPGSVSPGGGCG